MTNEEYLFKFFFCCYEDTEPRHRFADFKCTFTKANFNGSEISPAMVRS